MTVPRLFGIAAAASALAALAGRCQTEPSAPAIARASAGDVGLSAQAFDVRQYGAVGDGVADNSPAFAAVSAAVNRMVTGAGTQVTVLFPPGRYRYSSGLVFTSPVRLSGPGATLDYRGHETAVKLGPDGLTTGTWTRHIDYAVEGLTFTGGASMAQGIAFNTLVTRPRVTGVTFVNFGGGSAYAIWFQSHNRDARVTDTRFFADDDRIHQFIRANGADADGRSDQGQTRLTVSNVLAINQSTASGTAIGVYTNGFNSSISSSKIEGFSPAIQIGSNAGASSAFTRVDLVYMGRGRGSEPCILYGERDGPYRNSFIDHLVVERSYCNVFNPDFGTGWGFIGPASPGSELRSATLEGNFISRTGSGSLPVTQNAGATEILP